MKNFKELIKKIIQSKLIVLVVFASLVLSLSYSFYYRIQPVVDAQAYDKIAVNLSQGNGFKEEAGKSYEFDTAIVRAGPGYEFFLAGIYKILGHYYEAVWILQAILHALTALLVYLICRALFPTEKGKKTGLVAAVLLGFHPDLIEISAMLMTETLYLFFIVCVLWFFVKIWREPGRSLYVFLLSLSTATAIFSRPPVVLFVPIILVYYFLIKMYKPAIIFLVCLIIFLSPWVIRNYFVYHQFILTTLIGEYNLWVGNTLSANGGQISGGFNPLTSYTDIHGFFALKEKASGEFWSFIFGHPLVFVKLCAIRVARFLSLIRPMGFWFYQSGIGQLIFVLSSVASTAFLFISGAAGMIVIAFREKKTFLYCLIALALTSPLVLIPTVVESRYRFQIYPFLAIFSGYIIASWAEYDKRLKSKIFLALMVVFLAASLADFYLNSGVVVERIRTFF